MRELFGDRMAIAPYRMPGFGLAHLAAEVFEANPDTEGMVLLKHGIFTWGATAQAGLRADDPLRDHGRGADRRRARAPLRPGEAARGARAGA